MKAIGLICWIRNRLHITQRHTHYRDYRLKQADYAWYTDCKICKTDFVMLCYSDEILILTKFDIVILRYDIGKNR